MSLSNKERDRRTAKKLYEKVDDIFDDLMEDQLFTQSIVKDWAKQDPRGFMQLMEKRLPKVQPVDQDLQKMSLGLKQILGDLPEHEDLYSTRKKVEALLRKTEADLKRMTDEKEFWRKKCFKEKKKSE